jgi:hypothetical protein
VTSAVVAKYLARYAQPEAKLAADIAGHFRAVLIVPAHRERATLLDGFAAALRDAAAPVLVILVVNVAEDASDEARAETRALLAELPRSPDLFVVDRASPGRELPAKQGVGLARKIGADIALALWAEGRVELPFIFSTDADATLPADYFRRAEPGAAARLFPFRHVSGADAGIDAATALYERSLRYHVLGLAHAGSPYAYQSLGSALALDCESYAAVRGFPRRQAGEDFYVLDKLAKLGDIVPLGGEPIELHSRSSERVPFGTGPRVRALVTAGGDVSVYHPDCYRAVAAVLDAFSELARSRSPSALEALESPWLEALRELGFARELPEALAQSRTTAVLLRRLFTWFDALRTLRFIHALRDAVHPAVPLERALLEAPFVPGHDGSAAALIAAEAALSGPRGVQAAVKARIGPDFG